MTIVIDTPHFERELSRQEQGLIAAHLVRFLSERFDEPIGDAEIKLELHDFGPGCIWAKIKIYAVVSAVLGAAFATTQKYDTVRAQLVKNIPLIAKDVERAYKCVINREERECKIMLSEFGLSDEFHVFTKDDSLRAVVVDKWGYSPRQAMAVMRAIWKSHPDAFHNGEMSRPKAGGVIAKPAKPIRGIAKS